jgi:hypothetical protein
MIRHRILTGRFQAVAIAAGESVGLVTDSTTAATQGQADGEQTFFDAIVMILHKLYLLKKPSR